MGCGASSGPKKLDDATAQPDGLTTAPPPPEEDPKADAEKKQDPTPSPSPPEAVKKEEPIATAPAVEEVPTREPSEQQEPAPASGEKPEDLKAWSMELGEGGESAATKLQSAHRGNQARGEVEKMKKTKTEQAKEKDAGELAKAAPVEPVATETAKDAPVAEEAANQAAAGGAKGNSPEELQAWTSELGEGGPAAATKLQATHRGKQARAEVDKMRAAKQTAEQEPETTATAPEDAAAGPTSPKPAAAGVDTA